VLLVDALAEWLGFCAEEKVQQTKSVYEDMPWFINIPRGNNGLKLHGRSLQEYHDGLDDC
jgi:hypothetical protein